MGYEVLFNGKNMERILVGLGVTLEIAVFSVLISMIVGTIFGVIMSSKNRLVVLIGRIYIETIRIIPILVWLFIFYFGLTKLIGVHIDSFIISVVVFSMWGVAEMGDIVRGAITSIPKHQIESGRAIGLRDIQIYMYIIIPQSIKRMIPSAINLTTRMIKTTSLVALIGVIEVLKVGQQIIESSLFNNPSAPLWVYAFISGLYFIICFPVSTLSKKLETRWGD
ncbi:amino acid ABC transporter membrane protein 2, PAAT family [Asaccharospora irregularis DSM 2635]|uniref:Amino acid ABC transporter membrane protein 2, PAAT family n=2 Tax=Asaccharospora TaxID=1505660 RepID=A0A1M5MYF1_9FIRM|nr:amino acid ABC transporter membrane protein 2, PAAT family [Asaccharospora irregularis DSM 2635]